MKPTIHITFVAIVLTFALILGGLLYFTISRVLDLSARTSEAVNAVQSASEYGNRITTLLLRQYSIAAHYGRHPHIEDKQSFIALSREVHRNYFLLQRRHLGSDDLMLISSVKNEHFHFESIAMRLFAAIELSDTEEASKAILELEQQTDTLAENLSVLNDIAGNRSMAIALELDEAIFNFGLVVGAVITVAFFGLLFIYYIVRRNVLKPTNELIRGTRQVAEGQLDISIDIGVRNEFGLLASSFNEMVDRIKASRREISEKANALEELNREISALNESLEKKVEERTAALLSSRAHLRQIIQRSPVGISLFNRAGACTDCNDAFLRLVELEDKKDAVDKLRIGQGEQFGQRDLQIAFYGALQGEGRQTDPIRHMHGVRERWFVHSFYPLTEGSSDSEEVIVFSHDVTESKLAGDQIKAKVRELESFVYTVSHDLKSPLFSLTGLVRMLEVAEDAERAHLISRIFKNVSNMEQMIADLLQLSQVGIKGVRLEKVDLGEIARSVLLEEQVRFSNVQLERQIDEMPSVTADRSQMLSLFHNLISNSFKYRHPERPLKLKLSADSLGDAYLICVEDNGIGIESEDAGRIFDIFFSYSAEKGGGSGVGLAIAKKVVEVHGGRIWVDSRPGEGSRFYFTLSKNPQGTLVSAEPR